MPDEKKGPSLSERFDELARQKKIQAAEYRAKEKAERDKNNILLRWSAIRNGTQLDDELTDKELEIYASVDGDLSLLGLDEEGHICLLSSLKKPEAETGESGQVFADIQPTGETQSEKGLSGESTDAMLDAAAKQRKAALAAALTTAKKELGEDVSTPGATATTSVDDTGTVNMPDGNDEGVPVNEDVKVIRVENIGVSEARVYLCVAENPDSQECAYGFYVEQGYGETRQSYTQCEKIYGIGRNRMLFRAAASILSPYTRIGQPIHDVVIFVNRDDGWVLMQNSWNTVTEAYTLDAENYCQTFKSCAGRGVSVRMAPAESHSRGQRIARELVEAIIQTPA